MDGSQILEGKKLFRPPYVTLKSLKNVSFRKHFKPAMELAFGEEKGGEHKISAKSL